MARVPGSEPLALLVLGCLGWVAGGFIGAGVGLLAGYLLERLSLLAKAASDATPETATRHGQDTTEHPEAAPPREDSLGERFFRAAFLTLGHLSKADGHVSREEIQAAERIMQRMSLSAARRDAAMQRFREGKGVGVTLARCLSGLDEWLAGHPEISLLFLEVMLSVAWAEGAPGTEKRRVLQEIAQRLRVEAGEFARAEAQVASGRRSPGATAANESYAALEDAYRVLGIPPMASDGDVRRAYRRLISRHHPDKLLAQGLPDEWVAVANEHTHQIRRAWEVVSRVRGLR
ncbi:MAG TPA: co-chaperone DjlA [Gammaproteobacteria bacterium]|nr:co-chaperone DjlA [Gammaproteobacteria bacterium]